MKRLYDGIANSPIVRLTSSINNVQTVIPLTDVSSLSLPPAPNICTIGGGDNAETILYESKTTDALTDVTRGFQGTAKAWPTNTPVARNFTEYDFAAILENIRVRGEELLTTSTIVDTIEPNTVYRCVFSGDITVTIPDPSEATKGTIFKVVLDEGNSVTIDTASNMFIGNDTTLLINVVGAFVELQDIGSKYVIIQGANTARVATTERPGLMSAADKVKLDSIRDAYTHVQSVAASIWEVEHGLDKNPSVTVIDSAGTLLIGDVDYVNLNKLIITFGVPFTGKAYIV